MGFIAGGYTVSFNAVAVGQIEDGVEMEHVPYYEDIRGDNMGDTIQDGVYRGGDMFMSFTMLEYNAAAGAAATPPAWWPYHNTWGRIGTIGVLQTSLALAVVLTAVAGTSAATLPATLTASKCVIAKGFPTRMLFAPRNRRIPIRFQMLPYDSSGNNIFFSKT